MTDDQRIEGEFHYAVQTDGDRWSLRRKTDNRCVGAASYGDDPGNLAHLVIVYDDQARHFTATAVQEERERVLAEIDAAAHELEEFEVWAAGSGGFFLRLHYHTLVSEDGDEVDPEGDSLLDALTYATDALAALPNQTEGGNGDG